MTQKKVFIIIYFCIGVLVLSFFVIKENINYSKLSRVNYLTEVDSTIVKKANTELRGAIYIEKFGIVNAAYCELILNINNFEDWINRGPEISFSEIKYRNTLNDVPFPFLIYKKRESDTIYVRKDSFDLYFKLVYTE